LILENKNELVIAVQEGILTWYGMVKVVKALGACDMTGAQLFELVGGVNGEVDSGNFIVNDAVFPRFLCEIVALVVGTHVATLKTVMSLDFTYKNN
jgi:hypothetical protein